MRFVDRVHFAAQPVYLGPAGDAWLDAMTMQILLDRLAVEPIAGSHCDRVRARTDERHISARHIDKLRQLVHAEPTQDAPQPGDPRIVSYGAPRPRRVAPIDVHR